MGQSKRFAWTWTIKEEDLSEYVRMHLDPWPEVLAEHKRAGIKNYSIFQNGRQFLYCFECDDVKAAFQFIAGSKVCQEWNAITSKMVEGSFDFNQEVPIEPLAEVFFLA